MYEMGIVCEDLQEELQENSELIGKLKFYNDESIESLIYILSEMYKLKLEVEDEDRV